MKESTPLRVVGNDDSAPSDPVIERADGGAVVIVKHYHQAPHDDLVALSESGLEVKAWKALVRNGELPARRIGRKVYSTRSALLRLVLDAPKPAPKASVDVDGDYEALARTTRRSR